MSKIVVGVDGSEQAHHALRWALAQAQAHGSELVVVHVSLAGVPLSHVGELARLQEVARQRGEQTVSDALDKAGATRYDVPIRPTILWDMQPASALIDEAQSADLLVVGSRGLGGFRGMLLGSVSQHCVHHAPCPVVVVRSSEPARR